MIIHQLVPALYSGDAVANQALSIQRLLREWCIESQIYAAQGSAVLGGQWKDYRTYEGSRDNVMIYHHCIGSPVTAWARGLPDQLLLYYHNVTPAIYMAPYDYYAVGPLEEGRADLAGFVGQPYALAVSDYNRREMLAAGYRRVDLLQIIVNNDELHASAQSAAGQAMTRRFSDGCVNVLFVGRIAPNKRHDDLIKAFAFYRCLVNPRSRLLIAGSSDYLEGYEFSLRRLVDELAVPDVHWLGRVSLEDGFGGLYRAAHLFLCMSEHEGFGVPLVEAMSFDVPVLALKAAAIPETLGSAGVLFTDKRYEVVAEAIDQLVLDGPMRRQIIANQRKRLSELSPECAAGQLRHIVGHLRAMQEGPMPLLSSLGER